MNRRAFLVRVGAGMAATAFGGLLVRRRMMPEPDVSVMLEELRSWVGRSVTSSGAWTPSQIFTHIAQSIEYSMTGYPEAKPALFQQTVGATAFFAFSTLGKMKHNLADPIPGAPALDAHDPRDVKQGLDRVIAALQSFHDFTGQLRPHFAYGLLSKDEYAAAHLMHIRDHQSELRFEG